MAKKKHIVEEEEEIVEEEEETDEELPKKRVYKPRGPQPPRLSFTVPPNVRRKIRLAAAMADMEDPEWCRTVLVAAAKRTVQKYLPDMETETEQ